MALRLRLRGPAGKQQTASLDAASTFGDLRREAATAFSLVEGEVEVLLGFPPSLCTADPGAALGGLVKSGDTATVRQATGAPATQASSTAAFAPAPAAAPAPAPLPAATAAGGAPSSAARPAPARGVAGIRASEPWDCPACTLENPGTATICGACEGPRPGSSAAAPGGAGGAGAGGGDAGGAQLRKMPDDNSCLFHGIGYLLDPSKPPGSLRQAVASEVRSNPGMWSEAILGKPPSEYIAYITDPIRWGSQVELNIFSSLYRAEIAVIEIQSGRCDVYGEGSGFQRRVYLLHSGIHFDAVTFGPSAQREVSGAGIAMADAAAKQLAAEQRRAGNFTDQATMRLRCKICGYIANGDYEARAHAGGMGHKEFAPA
uniref:Ubiquitin thioesterase OTU n=1 Tax=Alexandrium monilatum TaxID=311494 RepID=A0A7S4QE89_9DINO|mmetsp:Transcript_80490/g.248299  ORF Transcript_80490/g.248299 Transcript_80490/m.248299 type:complete len:374 (+) Transcript_80490:79-1200(+)